MKFRLEIKVNGKTVMAATATAVMTYDMVARFVETYMPEKPQGALSAPIVMVPNMLGRLLECEIGTEFSDRWLAVGGKPVEYVAVKIEDESEW